jgi:hypothetical protein
MSRAALLLFTLAATAIAPAAARAWEPPTLAGVAERAALASSLHHRLTTAFGRPLGLYEPLALTLDKGDPLAERLSAIDPEGGYAPERGKLTALGWLTAGVVVEGIPADRGRNHFLDASTLTGLRAPTTPFRARMAAVGQGVGTVRGVFTGANFDGTGRSALAWVLAPRAENEWGLARFLDERERAATAATPAERDDALGRALLAAGAIVRVLASMGDPAHVRNDFLTAYEDERDPLGRYALARWGRIGVPEPGPLPRPTPARLEELFHDEAGRGLADRTARRFFSPGTLPPYASIPVVKRTDAGYVGNADVKRLAAVGPDGRYRLDARCHEEYAERLLPEMGAYAVAALEHLFRGRLEAAANEGDLRVVVRDVALGAGTLTLLGDDGEGRRTRLRSVEIASARAGAELARVGAPRGARRVAIVFRGKDAAGAPIVLTEELALDRALSE